MATIWTARLTARRKCFLDCTDAVIGVRSKFKFISQVKFKFERCVCGSKYSTTVTTPHNSASHHFLSSCIALFP